MSVDLQILADVKDLLMAMNEAPIYKEYSKWHEQINYWKKTYPLTYKHDENVVQPQFVMEELCRLTNGEAIVVPGVGQHQMFAANYYPFKEPRQWINSGGAGTMGFGLPAAIGAKVACPDRQVCCVTGDGSIQMNIQELSTCMQYKIPVIILLLNNRSLGMVKQWQKMFYGGRQSHSYMDSVPDFVKLAEAYNHVGIKVDKIEELEPALERAFELKDRVVFIDVAVDPEEHVYPMQIKFGSMEDMFLSKTEKTDA